VDIFIFASEQWLLISLLLVLIYIFALTERTKGGKPMTCSQLVSLMNADQAVLVDVRANADYQAGHVHGAINIPHTKIATRISEIEKHREKIIVLTDQMGQHAGGAGKEMTKQGYTVRRLSGGMSEWQQQNMPVVQGKKASPKKS
jgi:rhodanese-related sulfurtransferase|tara:strand:- start:440 stop:874 length:435 start_codon:yes stop_codon:yes gene_type:complete